jgi:hypothetical protein
LNIITGEKSCSPRVFIRLEKDSSLTVKQTFVSSDYKAALDKDKKEEDVLVNSNTRIFLDNHAILKHTYVQDLSLSSMHAEVISSDVNGESLHDLNVLQMGGAISRSE